MIKRWEEYNENKLTDFIDNVKNKVRSFKKYGDQDFNDDYKDYAISSVKSLSKFYDTEVKEGGLSITTDSGNEYILYPKRNILSLNGSEIFLTREETQDLLSYLDKPVNESNLILEEGDGGGAASGGAASGGAASGGGDSGGGDSGGSGDVSAGGGVAYTNNGNVSGMGKVSNATVSPTPGDPDGSEPGSGDVSFPLGVYTKNAGGTNVGGITGNMYTKMSKTKMSKKKLFQTVKHAKDKFGVSKTMSFQQFSNL